MHGQSTHLQGGWEEDESVTDAARRETVEEAGVRGVLEVGGQTRGLGDTASACSSTLLNVARASLDAGAHDWRV
jgi:8-oxo-dGTP pyrophosphatase MutT (NUDIX family)